MKTDLEKSLKSRMLLSKFIEIGRETRDLDFASRYFEQFEGN